jgi:hypothetical protein
MNLEKALNHNGHNGHNEKTMTRIVQMNHLAGELRSAVKPRLFVVPVASLWSESGFQE